MAKTAKTKANIEKVLTTRLELDDPYFQLEKLPGGKFSGNIVSDSFVGMSHVDRQRFIWDALEKEYGSQASSAVGTLLAYTKAEWTVPLQGDPVNLKRHNKSN